MDGYKVVLTRNGVEESFHYINIVHSKSPESFGYFPRSAIKPFQLIPLIHELLKKKMEIDLSEIAIFCASHSGELHHTEKVKATAEKYSLNYEDIYCEKQIPIHGETYKQLMQNNKNYTKLTKSLKSTQNYYNETKSLSATDIKEFSFLYILLKKPELIKDNFYLIENVKLFSNENKLLLEEIIEQTNNFENTDLESLKIDKGLIDRVLKYASIKHILVKNINDDQKILEILSELIRDLKNYELEVRILDLESRFSKDLSEATFNELKELKKLQKIN